MPYASSILSPTDGSGLYANFAPVQETGIHDVPNGRLTMMCWFVCRTTNQYGLTFSLRGVGPGLQAVAHAMGNSYATGAVFQTVADQFSPTNIHTSGVWSHICLVDNGDGTGTYYLNAVPVWSVTSLEVFNYVTSITFHCYDENGNYSNWEMGIACPRLYIGTLTQNQIAREMRRASPSPQLDCRFWVPAKIDASGASALRAKGSIGSRVTFAKAGAGWAAVLSQAPLYLTDKKTPPYLAKDPFIYARPGSDVSNTGWVRVP